MARGIGRRYRNERLFKAAGLGALMIGLGFLAFFFYTLVANGYTALQQTRILLDVQLDAAVIDPDNTRDPAVRAAADYQRLVRDAMSALFPDVTARAELRELYALVSPGAGLELQRAAWRTIPRPSARRSASGCSPTTTSTCSSRAT